MSKRRRGLAGLGRPGERFTLKQVRAFRDALDRTGQSDLRPGTCRKVAPGVEVCRNDRGEYRVTSKRIGNRWRV